MPKGADLVRTSQYLIRGSISSLQIDDWLMLLTTVGSNYSNDANKKSVL